MTSPSLGSVLTLVASFSLSLAACRSGDAPCALSICNVEDEACHAEVFAVIACAREFHGEMPPVEVIGPGEYDERFAEEPQDATAKLRDEQLTELLVALQLETRAVPGHSRPVAFYSLDTEEVIIVTTAAFDDETRVFVLMQAFANAQQDQEIDLRSLLREQPTSDAAIAAAALVHGEAHFSANLGMQLRRTGVELDASVGFYRELEREALASAADRSLSYAIPVGDFIYGYGGAMAAERWNHEEREGLSELLRSPPRSTFAILEPQFPGAQPTDPPDPTFELEAPYEIFAADTLGAWMFQIVLLRAVRSIYEDPGIIGFSTSVDEWYGDEALFVGGETPTDAALYWRLELGSFAWRAAQLLETSAAERRLPWLVHVAEGSLILVVAPEPAALPEWAARFGL